MESKVKANPAEFRPQSPKELIGQAGTIATAILSHVTSIKHSAHERLKLMLFGEPGIGKSEIANMAAKILAVEKFDIELVNGRDLTIEVIREWMDRACYASMWGGWKIKIVEEADLTPLAAQELMLTYLDKLPSRTAIIATSNADIGTLSARFQSRFQSVKIPVPTSAQISRWLTSRFEVGASAARFIAETCCGNVRRACLDAGSFLSFGVLPEKIEVKQPICSARSAAAHKAWATMRGGKAVAA